MSRNMFNELVDGLWVPLTVSFVQSMRSTTGNDLAVYPEVYDAIGWRMLGPSDTFEACAANLSLIITCFWFASQHHWLRWDLSGHDDKSAQRRRWNERYCAVVDRCFIRPPSVVMGSYQAYGLNIQATWDPNLLFLYVEELVALEMHPHILSLLWS